MSAFFTDLGRDIPRELWVDWLPGSAVLVVLVTALVLVVAGETTRDVLAGDRERRARAAGVLASSLLLCAALAVGSRLLLLVT